jgi:hypothetical protein
MHIKIEKIFAVNFRENFSHFSKMGYASIEQLYDHPEVFSKPEKFWIISEKIHGTSTWINFNKNKLTFHSGGEPAKSFTALFDIVLLQTKLEALQIQNPNVSNFRIHGEAYGGKQQKMAKTYGDKLKFCGFEVKFDDTFLDFLDAKFILEQLELEVVPYKIQKIDIAFIEEETKSESIQAIRNGMGHGLLREGIVIRPLEEEKDNNGKRLIYKYVNKCPPFSELKNRPNLGEVVKVMTNQKEIVEQWVTETRMGHVLDEFKSVIQTEEFVHRNIKSLIPEIVNLFVKDVQKEHNNSIVWSDSIEKAIKTAAGTMFVHHFLDELTEFMNVVQQEKISAKLKN